MTSPQAKKAVLEQNLHGLLSIKGDLEEALRKARAQLAVMQDEDSDSEKDNSGPTTANPAPSMEPAQPSPQTLLSPALQYEELPILTTHFPTESEDNTNEEDMSLASEDDDAAEEMQCDDACGAGASDATGDASMFPASWIQQLTTDGNDCTGFIDLKSGEVDAIGTEISPNLDCEQFAHVQGPQPQIDTVVQANLPSSSSLVSAFSRPPTHPLAGSMLYEIQIVTVIKNEVPLLTRINPAIQVNVARLYKDVQHGPLFWSLQVECAEHQTKWELATFVDEATSSLCKRSRTEFSDSLLIAVDLSASVPRWVETLPDIQLRAEREVWDPKAKACQAHRHRFLFRIGLVDANNVPVSHIAFSAPFRLAACFAALDDSIADQVLKARRVVRYLGDDDIRDRTNWTSRAVVDEREHSTPQVTEIEPKEIAITGSDDEYARISVTGKNFRQACVIRSDSEPPNEVQRAAFQPNDRVAGALIAIPKTSELMMLKVRNFDDPNLVSSEDQFLSFQKIAPVPLASTPMNLPNFDSDILSFDFFDLSGSTVSQPFPAMNKQENLPIQEVRNEIEVSTTPKPNLPATPPVGIDKFAVYHHIVNGYTHTVATMLQAMEFKKLLKLKLSMVPALLALLSENPCTFIVCLAVHAAEQQEITEAEFRQFLDFVIYPKRTVPLQPQMLFDFLQNEIGIDVRARFKKMACLLADSMVSDAESMIDDDSSDYSPEDAENNSTSDEDYEDEPPSKIPRGAGSRLRLSVKTEKPVPYPSKVKSKKGGQPKLGECDWLNCLLCEKDIPAMLQTQNPTWAAIMRVVFFSFIHIYPNDEFWMVRQAYKFIEDHWEKLCPGKSKNVAWRKQLQDALSHNKQYFISGMDKYGQKGYWGLKQIIDPWGAVDHDEQPKRAYHQQPRRGRPPKSVSATRTTPVPRRESNSYIYKCLKHANALQTNTSLIPHTPNTTTTTTTTTTSTYSKPPFTFTISPPTFKPPPPPTPTLAINYSNLPPNPSL